MGLVKFVSCTREQYDKLISKDEDIIYLVGDIEDGATNQNVEGNNESSESIKRIEP